MAVNGVFDREQLKLFFDRIDNIEEEIAGLKDDLKDVWKEAKAAGFDANTMKRVRVLMKMDKDVREEKESLYEAYKEALGLRFESTPLGATVTGDGSGKALPPASDEVRTAPGVTDEEWENAPPKGPISNSMSSIPGVEDSGLSPAPEPKKRGRPKKVRDPSNGALVTVPANGADTITDSAAG
jgi:uncharacterized protein (UPF0335 family)